eukprot:GILI01010495.1.p1 GENE.GILI01010495.1~~GILI01010495.1.p1  ORF type:complete len:191 (-),score=51.40 GILI01010495.1:29-601(-)
MGASQSSRISTSGYEEEEVEESPVTFSPAFNAYVANAFEEAQSRARSKLGIESKQLDVNPMFDLLKAEKPSQSSFSEAHQSRALRSQESVEADERNLERLEAARERQATLLARENEEVSRFEEILAPVKARWSKQYPSMQTSCDELEQATVSCLKAANGSQGTIFSCTEKIDAFAACAQKLRKEYIASSR